MALALTPNVYALIASILCLALNAFFVAAEFALVKVRITQLDRALKTGDRRARAAKAILGRLDRYLSVTQFGITVASLGLGWIAEPALVKIGDDASVAMRGAPLGPTGHIIVDVVGLGTLTFLHLLLGELVPKFIAIQHPVQTALAAALPLRAVNATFRPLLWLLESAQNVILRLLGIDPEKANEGTLSEDEIIGILAAAATRDPKSKDKRRVIERAMRFSARPVRQMMVPRVDVVSLPINATGEEAHELLQRVQFSRIPLVHGALDDVAGYLYAKDFLLDPNARGSATLRGRARPVIFLPESQDGLSALRDMQREATPFAVVVDEYGGTSGIVTMEDLVEEIVGEIRDELDIEPPRVSRLPGDAPVWDVDGQATADDLRDVGVPVGDEWLGEAIGAVVLQELGHLPRAGDAVRLAANLVAEVASTHRRRIHRLRVRLVQGANEKAKSA